MSHSHNQRCAKTQRRGNIQRRRYLQQRDHNQRRGIVLLVVLSLLTLFAILGVTFLLVAGQYKVTARSNARVGRHATPPEKLLHWAALQLLRDSNTRSMMQTHALLTDLYGESVRGVVIAAVQDTTVNGEFLHLRVVPDTNQPFGQTFSDQPDYYAGRVITFLNGSAGNLSARIVDYTAFKGIDGVWGTANGGSSSNGNDNDNTYDDGSGNNLPDINERAERFWINGAGVRSDDYAELRCELLDGRGTGTVVPAVGTQFLINGQPFNGTGHGYNPATSNIDLLSTLPGTDGAWGRKGVDDDGNGVVDDVSEAGWPMTDDVPAFAPAHSALLPNQMVQATPFSRVLGGADEDYDTFDVQNMFLAMVPPDLSTVPEIIPSFHRPALVNFWFNWAVGTLTTSFGPMTPSQQWAAFSAPFGRDRILGTGDDPTFAGNDRAIVVSILRAITMRPLPEDNPDFEVNNPDFHLMGNLAASVLGFGANGAWDVDNDGDGIPDSIWMDLGLPVQTGADGRRYRPLVAILCQDLDSRLNLNAHDKRPRDSKVDPSSTVDATTTFLDPRAVPTRPLPGRRHYLNDVRNEYAGTYNTTASNNNPTLLPRGHGVGGADVSVGPLFNNQPLPATYPPPSPAPLSEYEQVLIERYLSGGNGYPGIGAPSLVSPQAVAADDPLSAVKFNHMPSNYFDYFNNPTSYLSPLDLKGVMAIGLDPFGQPFPYAIPGADARIDDPYEMFLGNHFGEVRSTQDAPYTVAEFERLLRYNDREASRLPSRLIERAPQTFSFRKNRQQATVLSSYIPVPSSGMFSLPTAPAIGVPAQTLRGGSPAFTVLDLYFQRLFDVLDAADPTGPSEAKEDAARAFMARMLPFEFRHGQRFDLNRPFGNGVDDNGNKVVDEPAEVIAGQKAWDAGANVPLAFRNADFDSDNDDPVSISPRFNYARHLYCLMVMMMGQNYVMPLHPTGETTVTATVFTTRQRIAQWAVNVVDFRDADAIMTAFEYDTNPFNGWVTDGDPRTDEGTDGVDNDGDGLTDEADETERAIVWGCEAPDLLISETIALHDRGVKDTTWDDGSHPSETEPAMLNRFSTPMPDQSVDQYRKPQGSLFFELLCPRGNHMHRQYELYDAAGNLDLGRMSPNRTIAGNTVRSPVWRVAISPTPSTLNASQTGATPGTASSENYQPTTINRIVWFTNVDPVAANSPTAAITFFNQTTTTRIAPNGYMMVGPRAITSFGALTDTDSDPSTHSDSPHSLRINAAAGTFTAIDSAGVNITPSANVRTPAGMICAAHPPASWTNVGRRIGLNVSEPLPQSGIYYQEPNPTNDSREPSDGYANLANPIIVDLVDPTMNNSVPDYPFDERTGMPLAGQTNTGTLAGFTSCFLQRLADPTQPWNPLPTAANHDASLLVNPYITVDWASVDLTVFAGDENTGRIVSTMPTVWLDPTDPDPYGSAPPENVRTRQRDGALSSGAVVTNQFNIWSPHTLAPAGTTPTQHTDAYFPFELNAYNSATGTPGMTLGYLNSSFGDPTTPQPGYAGAPASPFPWMAWNNRPFTSPYELLMVPASSPSRMLLEFTASSIPSNFFGGPLTTNPYSFGANSFPIVSAPSAHSLNFLHSSTTSSSAASGNFHRLLDFVEVPSPYLGAEKWYNPTNVAYNTSLTPAQNRGGDSFRPPFNKLSRFRDPGRVNINTILYERSWSPGADLYWGNAGVDDDGNGTTDDIGERGWPGTDDTREARVWEGIAKNFPELDPSRHTGPRASVGADGVWGSVGDDNGNGSNEEVFESEWPGSDDVTNVLFERLLLSRQGYGTHANDILTFNPAFPTRFNHPFRTAASADLNPLAAVRQEGVEATFMRSDPVPHMVHPGPDGTPGTGDDITRTEPLLVPDPAISPQLNLPYRDQNRNPYFRYQGLQHIGNVLSTTSNTFAVWLTVGYFEVEDNPSGPTLPGGPDLVHPDGLRLGQELGLDTGEVKRHRAFYIMDRSVPVAYEPGQNHNVEKAILLRRFIE